MSQRILVVEDEPAIADTITYALTTEGFEVVWRATGGEARGILAEGGVDLIVLDVGLPDCNGFDLCREIRQSSKVPILFLTARRDEIDRVVGLEIGGDDYVIKPFSPRELSARVKAILRRSSLENGSLSETSPTGDEEPRSSPFAIDQNRRRISYFGQPLDLARCEYRLLEILIQRPGWVFTRDHLLQLAWKEPGFSTDRTVDTHIKTIRAKLREVNPDLNPIRTHRGLGYSLKES
jgi:two-component system catabolic regulation response regulator CreB